MNGTTIESPPNSAQPNAYGTVDRGDKIEKLKQNINQVINLQIAGVEKSAMNYEMLMEQQKEEIESIQAYLALFTQKLQQKVALRQEQRDEVDAHNNIIRQLYLKKRELIIDLERHRLSATKQYLMNPTGAFTDIAKDLLGLNFVLEGQPRKLYEEQKQPLHEQYRRESTSLAMVLGTSDYITTDPTSVCGPTYLRSRHSPRVQATWLNYDALNLKFETFKSVKNKSVTGKVLFISESGVLMIQLDKFGAVEQDDGTMLYAMNDAGVQSGHTLGCEVRLENWETVNKRCCKGSGIVLSLKANQGVTAGLEFQNKKRTPRKTWFLKGLRANNGNKIRVVFSPCKMCKNKLLQIQDI